MPWKDNSTAKSSKETVGDVIGCDAKADSMHGIRFYSIAYIRQRTAKIKGTREKKLKKSKLKQLTFYNEDGNDTMN